MHSRTAGKTLKSGRFGAQSIIFVVGLVVAVVMIIATYEQLVGSRSDARLLAHALEVQNKLAGLRILVRRAEGDQLRVTDWPFRSSHLRNESACLRRAGER